MTSSTSRFRAFRTPFLLFFAFFLPSRAASGSERWVEVRSAHFTVVSNSGEKEARRIANQFEEIRGVFLQVFTTIRVDAGKPMMIIAVKNEDSMKLLLPDYWAAKDRMHPAGVYHPDLDRNFAVLRTDLSGSSENPYHSLDYEYTQSILRLNFPGLPTWLEVGLGEFYGNTVVDSGEVRVGLSSRSQLSLLRHMPLIPVKNLLFVDQRSPLFNENNRVEVTYAECWLIVHYLMNDPRAQKEQFLMRFLRALGETKDADAATKEAFGDLDRFELGVKEYSTQTEFRYMRMRPQAPLSDKDYPVRDISQAEALTAEADFLAHIGHGKEAKPMFEQAQQQQPTLAAAYTGLGYVQYVAHENDAAMEQFDKAIALNPDDFRPYHFKALLILRKSGYHADTTPQIITNLERVIALNPDFAPAYGFLSVAYRQQEATKVKGLEAAKKAATLDPNNMAYFVDLGENLLALDREPEASKILEEMTKAARTPSEKTQVENFAKRLTAYRERVAKKNAAASVPAIADATAKGSSAITPAGSDTAATGNAEGVIREVACNAKSSITLRFAILGDTLSLAINDPAKVAIRVAGKDASLSALPCEQWQGRKARIAYTQPHDTTAPAEVVAIDFL